MLEVLDACRLDKCFTLQIRGACLNNDTLTFAPRFLFLFDRISKK